MTWKNIMTLKISETGGLSIEFGPLILLIIFLVLLTFLLYRLKNKKQMKDWDVIETEISLGHIGKVKIKPSFEDIQVAHKAWVELATRKAGLLLDEEHDVIVEIYNSWYELFREMRTLTKQIPAEKIRNSKDTQELVRLLVDALNQGLRPHLTQWQAKFRRWYSHALETNKDKTPQQIQKEYPGYEALIDDLKHVNKELIEYSKFIKDIAQGRKGK